MSVTLRSKNVWLVQIATGRDPVSGKTTRVSRVVRGLKRDALAVERKLLDEREAGGHGGSGHTFGELVEKWFASMSPDWSPATAVEHRRIIDTKLVGLSRMKLDKITPATLDDLYSKLRSSGGKDGGELALTSVRRIHVVVRASLEQGVRWGWIAHNPALRAFAKKIKPPKSKVVPTVEAVQTFLEVAWQDQPWLATLITLDAHTAMRRGELLALRWTDLNREEATLKVERVIVVGPKGIEEKLSTKNDRDRTLPLTAQTMAVLASHRKWCIERALAAGKTVALNALLFSPAADGSMPYWPSSVTRAVRLLCQDRGIKPTVTLQQLRRFVSSVMYLGGVDPVTEAGTLGHGSAVAMRDYAETRRPEQRRAMQVVVDALAAGG